MKHYMDEFDDNCYYLDILRWFRDNYVSLEDKKEYYSIAPKVVETINELENSNEMYNQIYYKVIQLCVRLIEYGRYDEAYCIYKENVLDLQNKYVKKLVLNNQSVKSDLVKIYFCSPNLPIVQAAIKENAEKKTTLKEKVEKKVAEKKSAKKSK